MEVYDVGTSVGPIRVLSLDAKAALKDAKMVIASLRFNHEVEIHEATLRPDSNVLKQYCNDEGGHERMERCAKVCGYMSEDYRSRAQALITT